MVEKRRASAHVDRAPGQVLQAGNRILLCAHYHEFVHLVIGQGKRRLRPSLLGNGHRRGHDVAFAFVQIRQQVGVTFWDDDIEPQVVPVGKFLYKLVFKAHLSAAMDKIGQRIIAGDHAQPPTLL